ncbi:hypothetical protein BT96DRAFT_475490 [Gymnopus androsaceus JB14]|uniref:Uncharacterized protein n=1 Tax=Gymnopus androsaceus JB14 TaxID=1447944 RepID=A0A6A4GPM4_9AGAR|nr:hypothetical protein BT96DRAFT_475490 [Gymnopus androsaceus JB14]
MSSRKWMKGQILSRVCNGTGAPLGGETVTLLGAYSDTDPGILIDVRVLFLLLIGFRALI